MCGIAGVAGFGLRDPNINNDILKKMSDVIEHRGPDAEGQWVSENHDCGLAFRRLAIIDLSEAGNQPMSTPDGKLTIVFNGEIYNHLLIREELIKKGYRYHSKTDTETILFGYQEYGKEIVNKLSGMFAFAIWDDENKELFCARDRIGKKPLYYYSKNGIFVFASEIKSILQYPGISPEMNLEQIPNYLNFGMSDNQNSLFKDIHKLPSAHFIHLKKNGDLLIKRYWSPITEDTHYTDLSENEIEQEIISIIRDGVKDRMMSDVPFGVFLSGGIDSSLNVALMAELMNRPVDTYTVGFKELEKYNELKYARQISEIFKTNHHEILIDQNDAFPILENLVWHEDEPNGDPVCIPLWFLSKLTRESGTIVIQVGEGSDEQYVGYPWMMREYNFYNTYWKFFNSFPQSVRKLSYDILKPLLKGVNLHQVLEYFRRAAFDEPLYWSGMPNFSYSNQEDMFGNGFTDLKHIPTQYAKSLYNELKNLKIDTDFLQQVLFVELNQRLAEILLMRVDKIGMAHSIEARVPFLDYRLVEFSMKIPQSKKVPDKKTTKYILKNAIRGILPDEIIHRKKQGFWAPVNEWLRDDWYDFASSVITDSYFVKEKILKREYIEKMMIDHHNGKKNNGLKIFSVLMLSMWWNRFFR